MTRVMTLEQALAVYNTPQSEYSRCYDFATPEDAAQVLRANGYTTEADILHRLAISIYHAEEASVGQL